MQKRLFMVTGSLVLAFSFAIGAFGISVTTPASAAVGQADSLDYRARPVILASAVGTPGVQTALDVPWLGVARVLVDFSASDVANDVRIEISVDGGVTFSEVAKVTTDDKFVNFSGPLDEVRANVVGLGAALTVTVKGKSTVGFASLGFRGAFLVGDAGAANSTLRSDGVSWIEATNFLNDGTGLFVGDENGVVIGHTVQVGTDELQILGTGDGDTTLFIGRWTGNASGPKINFIKSRNATIGSNTIVSDNDFLGEVALFPRRWR